jgi:hypothetical protein
MRSKSQIKYNNLTLKIAIISIFGNFFTMAICLFFFYKVHLLNEHILYLEKENMLQKKEIIRLLANKMSDNNCENTVTNTTLFMDQSTYNLLLKVCICTFGLIIGTATLYIISIYLYNVFFGNGLFKIAGSVGVSLDTLFKKYGFVSTSQVS